MPTRSGQIRATPEELFAVLTDYEKYPDWSPDVVAAAVLVREGDIVVAEFQSPFLMDGKYILEFVHTRPSSIAYRQVDQHDSRGLQGTWKLSASANGVTVATGEMEFRTDFWKRGADRRRAERVLQRRVDALQAHVEAMSRRGAAAEGLPEASAFEALPEGQALTIWAADIEYRFVRTSR